MCAPISARRGHQARCRNCTGGAIGLCVPPASFNVDGLSAFSKAGSTVCSTSVQLPAVPIANA